MNMAEFTADDKRLLRDEFVGNELDSDEYREAWPEKGLHYLTGMGETRFLDDTEGLLDAILTWLTAWNTEGRGNYAGADAARTFLALVFEDAWFHGRLPYYDSPAEIRAYLACLKER